MEFDNVCRGLNFVESYFVPLNCFEVNALIYFYNFITECNRYV